MPKKPASLETFVSILAALFVVSLLTNFVLGFEYYDEAEQHHFYAGLYYTERDGHNKQQEQEFNNLHRQTQELVFDEPAEPFIFSDDDELLVKDVRACFYQPKDALLSPRTSRLVDWKFKAPNPEPAICIGIDGSWWLPPSTVP